MKNWTVRGEGEKMKTNEYYRLIDINVITAYVLLTYYN